MLQTTCHVVKTIITKRRLKETEKSLTDKAVPKLKMMIVSGHLREKKKLSPKVVISRQTKRVIYFGFNMLGLIHIDSTACAMSKLGLFSIRPTQTDIQKKYFTEYHSIANIRDRGPVEISISGNDEDFIHLSSSHLHMKVKVIKTDGNALPEKEPVVFVHLFLQAQFYQLDISNNEGIISSSTNSCHYRSCIRALLNYGKMKKKFVGM